MIVSASSESTFGSYLTWGPPLNLFKILQVFIWDKGSGRLFPLLLQPDEAVPPVLQLVDQFGRLHRTL